MARRAAAFYNKQMLDHLNPLMLDYLATQEMAFIATADGHGECDCSFRAGPPGFVRALDERTLIYPELRGNGVMASMGNMSENPNIGILFVDFYDTTIGLHVNGRAGVVDDEAVRAFGPMLERFDPSLFELPEGTKAAEQWVVVHVEEAYIHCSKHIPLVAKLDKDIHWATDDNVRKGGDYFKAKHSGRPWVPSEPVTAAAPSADTPVEPSGPHETPVSPAIEVFATEASALALVEAAATRALEDAPGAHAGTDTGDVSASVPDGDDEPSSTGHHGPPETPQAVPTADQAPLPDWAVEFASMSGVDWTMVADIARRIGAIETPDPSEGSQAG